MELVYDGDDITIDPEPTRLDAVLPNALVSIIQASDIEYADAFRNADPDQLAETMRLNSDRIATLQDEVDAELGDRDVVEYTIVEAYRHRDED